MSLTQQEILQHAHSMVVEYCLLNGDSHNNLINALTRDIYRSKHGEEMEPFHLHIKKCSAPSHHKYNQKVHIVHFSQIKWLSTLQQRPHTMLPTAHHLILFFNRTHIPNLDINFTKCIHEEFIVQCLMSMDPADGTKWEQYLTRYCIPYEFCPNYKDLHQLKGHSKSSKVYRDFLTKHSWKSFTNDLNRWCENVFDGLQLTPSNALLYRLTQALKRTQINNSFHIEDKQQNGDDMMHIDDDDSDANNSEEQNQEKQIMILSDDEEEDHHGLKLMSSKDSSYEEDETEDTENKNGVISDNQLNLDAAKLPQSMPSLEMGSQSMQMDDEQPALTQNIQRNHDLNENESPDLCEQGGSIGASQIINAPDASQQSETSTSELLQSQNNIDVMEQSQYPVASQPQCGGFNFGAFGDAHDNLDRAELLPLDQEASETESPPEQNSVFVPSQIAMDVDYLSQNKPPSHIQSHDGRGTKRTYDELERLSNEAPLTQNVKRARINVENHDANKENKMKCIKGNTWESWMKKGAEVTVELEDDLWLSIVRKVSAKFVLIKITDDDAPNKYKQKQLKIYLKDKKKIEPVMEMHETQSDEEQIQLADNHESRERDANHSVSEIDKELVWQYETERASQDNIASPPELTQELQNNEDVDDENDDNEDNNKLKSLLKHNGNQEKTHNHHVRWNLTLSQEQRATDKEHKRSAYEYEDDEEEEEEDVEQSSVFNMFKPGTFSSHSMPQQLINREFITDPDKACGLRHSDNKFQICGSKKRKRVQRKPWTDQEIDCLIKGVEKYKKYENAPRGKQGIWAYIMKDPKFGKILIKNQRDNTNLCDKWRHLVAKKDSRVRHLLDENTDSKKKLPKLPTRPVR